MKVENFNTNYYQNKQSFGQLTRFSNDVQSFVIKRSKLDTALPGVIKTVRNAQKNNRACDIVTFIRDNNLVIRLVGKYSGQNLNDGYIVKPGDCIGNLSHAFIEANIFANRANHHVISNKKIIEEGTKQTHSLKKALKNHASIFDAIRNRLVGPLELKP